MKNSFSRNIKNPFPTNKNQILTSYNTTPLTYLAGSEVSLMLSSHVKTKPNYYPQKPSGQNFS